jgi:uncharacterized protein (DUF342 family)
VLEKEIEANGKRETDLRKAVAHLHSEKDEQALATVVEQLGGLREEAAQIKAYATLAGARVVVDRNVYSGTEIHIGSRCWTSHDDHANGVFRLRDGEIVCDAS